MTPRGRRPTGPSPVLALRAGSRGPPPVPDRVLLRRHAETANPLIFHGAESDVGLSERGRAQAEAVAPVLAAFGPGAVVSSAMRRALDTAGPIARACGLAVRVEPDLHERR